VSTSLSADCLSRYVVRVRFGDTDLMGITHHAVYLSYFEAGRVEYLHRRGIAYTDWTRFGVHLPVIEAQVRYRKPTRFDERLVVETRLTELTRVKVRFEYRLLRETPDAELVAEGYTLLACVDDAQIPRRIPPEARELLSGPETAPRPIDCV
jgi:acyl-CoA thioester hydrolase